MAIVTRAPAAAGDPAGFSIGPRPVWFVTGGATAGGTIAAGTRGGYVGGELSLVRLRENQFLGLYSDAYYDFGVDGTYVTCGPELGLIRRSRALPIAVGIDGGAALRRADETSYGATARVFVALAGSFSIYARYTRLDADRDPQVVQVGVTLKFPLSPPFGTNDH